MSTPLDPYRPPEASVDGPAAPPPSTSAIPGRVVALLAETRPWVKLMAILFFVGMGMAGLGMIGAMAMVPAPSGAGAVLPALIPMILVLLLYIPSAVFMWRYAASIQRLEDGGGVPALEQALASQKNFWKYVGVIALVVVGIYFVVLFGGMIVGFGAGRSMRH
jgi:hypothetical protein